MFQLSSFAVFVLQTLKDTVKDIDDFHDEKTSEKART